ncbi:MAG: hypothetical protein IKS71_01400 [Bacteroidales bacterium]|nr:hypothetical protein [Bacteroidales bacterium]
MKKIVIAFVLFLSSLALSAQPRSFGVRFGAGLEISYQHNLGSTQQGANFFEFDAGVIGYTDYPGYRLSAMYDFTLMKFHFLGGDWNMALGPGVTLGMYDKSKFVGGLVVQYALSYDFPTLPISVGIDTRPCFIFSSKEAVMSFKEMIPMASLRWRF